MFSCWNFLTLQIKSVNENKITLSPTVIPVPSRSRHLVGLHQPPSSSLPPLLWTGSGTVLWQAKRRAHGGAPFLPLASFVISEKPELFTSAELPQKPLSSCDAPSFEMAFCFGIMKMSTFCCGHHPRGPAVLRARCPFHLRAGYHQKVFPWPLRCLRTFRIALFFLPVSFSLPGTLGIPKCGALTTATPSIKFSPLFFTEEP